MMYLEKILLNKFLDKYENSKVSKGTNVLNIHIRIFLSDSIFDNFRNGEGDELSFVLEKIQRRNFCRLHYTHFKTLDYIELNVEESSINKLYEYLNRENPKETLNKFKKIIFKFKDCGDDVIFKLFTSLEKDNKLSSYKFYLKSPYDATDILRAIIEINKLDKDIYERMLSTKLYSDSKRFGKIKGKIALIFKDFSGKKFDEEDDILEELGVSKSDTPILIKGNIIIKKGESLINGRTKGISFDLSRNDINDLEIKYLRAKRIITIENLYSYKSFNDDDYIAIYLAGYHNKAKRELLKIFCNYNNALSFYHYGDIDVGGFRIYNHLKQKTNIPFIPFKMGVEELVTYRRYCKELTQNDKNSLKKMRHDTKFTIFYEVIDFMLENGIKLEQEAEELVI